jgi:DNA-binding transcriptional ArsR family regulator
VTDTRNQTAAVMASLADETARCAPDLSEWHALQTWLDSGGNRVTVPYASKLAQLIPPVSVRLRRDFGAVLNLVRSHDLLHQASRERDKKGRIVATIEDYGQVRELVVDLVSEVVEATVSPAVREVVASLHHLVEKNDDEPVSAVAVAENLKLDRSAASRRLKSAIDKGYAENREDRRGHAGKYVLGEPLPEDVEILPLPEEVVK